MLWQFKMKFIILSLTIFLTSCQTELRVENNHLKSKVLELEKELISVKSRQEKQIIETLIEMDWEQELKKMKSWDNQTLKNETNDLNKNRESCEKSIEMYLKKMFTYYVCFVHPNEGKYERQRLEDNYLKSVFLYKLSKLKHKILTSYIR